MPKIWPKMPKNTPKLAKNRVKLDFGSSAEGQNIHIQCFA